MRPEGERRSIHAEMRHVGPRIAMRLVGTLSITSVEQLYDAARMGRLRQHYGFGERSERRLAEAARVVLDDRARGEHETAETAESDETSRSVA